MGNPICEDLSWLPQPGKDFSERLASAETGSELRELAKLSLDENLLRKLAKKHSRMQSDGVCLAPLSQVRIGLLSNNNTKLFAPALIGTALRFGISLTVVEAGYNQVAQEAFSGESSFIGPTLSAILVALDHRGLPLLPTPGDRIAADKTLHECLVYIKSLIESLRTKTGAQVILQNIVAPAEVLFGSYEGRLPGTLQWLITRLNIEIDSLVSDNILILDVAGLAANVGLASWHDPTLWNIGKIPFAQQYLPIYCDYVSRILAARIGKSRRCLVLDLDNTLWGGVIGDDGIEGILIGNGDPTGEAYLAVQRMALDLCERGIVLAVSSKNEDAEARRPFREHPDMLIRENHIAVFQANWGDKASNIRAIAETLSLGLESIVFLDDNPAERMQVRKELPEVAVPELPDDPALFARTLIAAGYFEAIAFSEEDRQRASFYQGNAERSKIFNHSSDIRAYLMSLEMDISFADFDATSRGRITQLINKSNQFNLTTPRYSETDVKSFEESSAHFTRQIRLKDVLGDNGMICVVICKKHPTFWKIDTWLMSCRVLGRRVEDATLLEIAKHAKESGVSKLIGIYRPTPRNILVKDHYLKLGFIKSSGDCDVDTWELDLSHYHPPELPMNFT
ncbi:MAG: HAD-IIIC family phosphatase [Glaciimonas sp.]|nr:HAD-IIIC family phosphatase [Glaciimonas sp.]